MERGDGERNAGGAIVESRAWIGRLEAFVEVSSVGSLIGGLALPNEASGEAGSGSDES